MNGWLTAALGGALLGVALRLVRMQAGDLDSAGGLLGAALEVGFYVVAGLLVYAVLRRRFDW